MAVYRIYLVHDDGRLQPGASFYCKTDDEAASRLEPPGSADLRTELWQGGRFIAAAGWRRPAREERPYATG
ncbi:MAG TPA: hypothetical protein VFE10_07395 [Phenylobacterium sp.]|jgi:hypothetical protein|nr:hypothetical protein [Phenylobacterium sp.]